MRKIYLLDLFDLLSMSEGMFDKKSAHAPKKDEDWTKTVEEFEKGGYVTKKETWVSKDGSSRYVKTTTAPKADPKERIDSLEKQLMLAVEKEEFEKAAEIRDKIKEIKKES